jgi:adenosylhomocysteine nucleosidase
MKLRFSWIVLGLLLLFSQAIFAQQKPTAIIGAMDAEIEQFKSHIKDKKEVVLAGITFYSGQIEARPVVLVKSGIGKVNAAMTTALLIEHFKPAQIIFTGIAGGVGENLSPGDIVVAEKTAQHDFGQLTSEGISVWNTFNREEQSNPLFFDCDTSLVRLAEEAFEHASMRLVRTYDAKRKPKLSRGVIVTGDVFVASEEHKKRLIERFNAAAVEMEGAAVGQICHQQNIPYLVIRSISDTADEDAEKFYKKFMKVAAFNSANLVIELLKRLS